MILTQQEQTDALRSAVRTKIAAMSDEQVAAFVATAEAEKVAEEVALDAQAGGRLTFHGYKDTMEAFKQACDENGGDKVAALQKVAAQVESIDEHFVELSVGGEAEKSASDAFSEQDAEGLAKIASDESLPMPVRQVAHDTLVRHGYQLVEE